MSAEDTAAASTAKNGAGAPRRAADARTNAHRAAAPPESRESRAASPGKSEPATNTTDPPRSGTERGAVDVTTGTAYASNTWP